MNVDDDEEESEIKSQIMRILYINNNNNKLSHSYLSVVVRIIPISVILK